MEKKVYCVHLDRIDSVQKGSDVCEECIKTDGSWVHLRTCQSCGVTLCCSDSPEQHMNRHCEATGHPVIASAEVGEHWLWCYPDRIYMKYSTAE